MPPNPESVFWATIIRACLMALHALDARYGCGIWKKHDKT